MMLYSDAEQDNMRQFADAAAAYVEASLHIPVSLRPILAPPALPAFYQGLYRFIGGHIAEEPYLLMLLTQEDTKATDLRKHISHVANSVEEPIIIGSEAMSPRRRDWFIKERQPFIVPGHQIYLPQFGAVLNETYTSKIKRPVDELSPASQAVLFYLLLRPDSSPAIPSKIAKTLWYTAMSIGRALDELEALELIRTQKVGRKREANLRAGRLETFERARDFLRSPTLGHGHPWPTDVPLPNDALLSGESALAELTMLSATAPRTYAIHAADWPAASRALVGDRGQDRFAIEDHEAEIMIEMWQYNPSTLLNISSPFSVDDILLDEVTVDPLSLFAQFHRHEDERLRMAADELIEEMQWSQG